MSDIGERIRALEETLLHSDPASDPGLIESLLGEGLREISRTGRVSSREQVLDWLRTKGPELRWELTDFAVRRLADDLVLATYRATRISDRPSPSAFHSSVWRRNGPHWQMEFHQATRIAGD